MKQGNPQRIYHGPVTCDPLTRVMDDVAKFMGEGHKEAVVLEFSHWDGFGDACPTVAGAYEQFRDTVYSRIGRWMYREPTHPAQVDLTDLLSDGGKVIVLIDRFALAACNQQEAGFYVYQGWGTAQERLSQGEFTVLDSYSNTTDYSFIENRPAPAVCKFHRQDGARFDLSMRPVSSFLDSYSGHKCLSLLQRGEP